MSSEIKTIGQQTGLLNALNQHNESPGGLLMAGEPREHSGIDLSKIDHFRYPDGSCGVRLDVVGRGLLAELPLGSIVGFIDVRQPVSPQKLGDKLPKVMVNILAHEMVALVLEQGPQHTLLAALQNRKLNPDGTTRVSPWSPEPQKPFDLTQKEDAILALRRLFDPSAGIEGSQMQTVFDTTLQLPQDGAIQSFGCFSHNVPKAATQINLMRGNADLHFFSVQNNGLTQWVRIGIQPDGVPTSIPFQTSIQDEEGYLVFQGMIAASQRVARSNPTGMGSGTNPLDVFEAMVESSIALPEQAMNGATVHEVQQAFNRRLGIRS